MDFYIPEDYILVRIPALSDYLKSSGSGKSPRSLVRIIQELLENVAAPV
jgi:hypothetical protein